MNKYDLAFFGGVGMGMFIAADNLIVGMIGMVLAGLCVIGMMIVDARRKRGRSN